MAPQKLEKKLRKEEKVKKAITIEKKKEIVQTYESGVRVTDLANTETDNLRPVFSSEKVET